MVFRRLYKQLRKYWFVFIFIVMIISLALGPFSDRIQSGLAPTCDVPIRFHRDVPEELRAQLTFLEDNDLLYCGEPSDPFLGLDGPIYWGADGMTSILFFQAESLRGVGVTTYGYGSGTDLFTVTPPGDAPPPGYRVVRAGDPAIRNQAEVEDATYYVYRAGAPLETDSNVRIVARGREVEDDRMFGGGDVLDDIDRLMTFFGFGSDDVGPGVSRSILTLTIYPKRWDDVVRRHTVEELQPEDEKDLAVTTLRRARERGVLEEPRLYQTASGAFGSSVWATMLVSDTEPVLQLTDPGGEVLEPRSEAVFFSERSEVPLAMFAFDVQPEGATYDASFWIDRDERERGAAPRRWEVVFP